MNKALFSVLILAGLWMLPATGAAVPESLPRHTLTYSPELSRISVDLLGGISDRAMKLNGSGAQTVLSTESGGVQLGFDFLPWLTGFGTLGASSVKEVNENTYGSSDFMGGVGLNANLWRTDLTHPIFIEGTISFSAVTEYKHIASNGDRTDYNWNEISVTLPLTYEMFTDYGETMDELVYSLRLFAGPSYSTIDGNLKSGSRTTGFTEAQSIGTSAGASLYFSDNFSLSCQVRIFKNTETTVGIFYHF